MTLPPKAVALAASVLVALSAATIAQQPGASRSAETLSIPAHTDWLEQSYVSALQEGVIKKMEVKIGSILPDDGTIGNLYDEKAVLTVARQKVAATSEGPIKKAEAQRKLALTELARLRNLNKRGEGYVSQTEMAKGEADLEYAVATLTEARENKDLAEAELALAERVLEEHTIRAPFAGVITERMKNPGESVKANEPVVRLGKIDALKVFGDVALEGSYRIQVGDVVDVKPEVEGVDLPIEQKRFRGKVKYVAREIVSARNPVVTVFAEVQNNAGLELLPGSKAVLTIYLGSHKDPSAVPPPAADPTVPAVGLAPKR